MTTSATSAVPVRCAECGHSMARTGYGYICIENTCFIGLAVLGDFASAERKHRNRLCRSTDDGWRCCLAANHDSDHMALGRDDEPPHHVWPLVIDWDDACDHCGLARRDHFRTSVTGDDQPIPTRTGRCHGNEFSTC